MNYIKVFQLAEQKGYQFTTSWYEDSDEVDLLQLTLIQKWLRDKHNLHIQNNVVPKCEGFPNGRWGWIISDMNVLEDLGKGLELYKRERNCDAILSYEQALLEGINEVLKLIK